MRLIDARRMPPARREYILKREGYQCAYCMEDANEVDHILPWAFIHCDDVENLVAACRLCNAIASDNVFDDFNAKRDHILKRREKIFQKRIVAIWTEAEVETLGRKLQQGVRAGAIVVDSDAEVRELAERLRGLGFNIADRKV